MSKKYEYTDLETLETADMDSVVASVWMLLNTPVNECKIVTVVEGQDDVEFYSRFFVQDGTLLYPDGNCNKHLLILSALNGEYGNRLIAIKDADFDRLNDVQYEFDNLFLTDSHDMEGMALSNGIPESFKKKYFHLMKDIELSVILSDLRQLSFLKWFNSRQSARLKFKGLSLSKFYESTFSIDIKDLFEASKLNTENVINWLLCDVDVFEQENADVDIHQLCRGHDVFECIYIRAHKVAQGHNLLKTTFFRDLRLSYVLPDFCKSILYSELKRWSVCVGVNLLVA